MGQRALLPGDIRRGRAERILVVDADEARCHYLTAALASVTGPHTVTAVSSATEARRAIESGVSSGRADEPWFVICGLSALSWSTLVLLEWIRGRAEHQQIETALLTDTVAELLPVAVVDSKLRVMSASPPAGELHAWIGLTAESAHDTASPQPQMTGLRG